MAKREKLIELIKKLQVMAQKGEPNERLVAKIKLENICVKYGINIADIIKPKTVKKRIFRLHSFTDEKEILIHCILDTAPDAEINGNEALRQIHVKLTESAYQEVLKKFNHYWELYLKERDSLLTAFIIKNDIGIIERELTENEMEKDVESIIDYLNIIKEESYNSSEKLKLN